MIDDENVLLEGVKVTVGSFFTLTNKRGEYELKIGEGENLTVFFTSFGYEPDTIKFSIEKGGYRRNKSFSLSAGFPAYHA